MQRIKDHAHHLECAFWNKMKSAHAQKAQPELKKLFQDLRKTHQNRRIL